MNSNTGKMKQLDGVSKLRKPQVCAILSAPNDNVRPQQGTLPPGQSRYPGPFEISTRAVLRVQIGSECGRGSSAVQKFNPTGPKVATLWRFGLSVANTNKHANKTKIAELNFRLDDCFRLY